MFVKYQYEKFGAGIDIRNYISEGMIKASLFNQLGIISKDGVYIISNLSSGIGAALSDREHFKVHVKNDTNGLFISKPLLGRASGKWSIQMSRRINGKDGSFNGVAVGSLDTRYLTTFYEQVNVGFRGVVMLIGEDGVVRARRAGLNTDYGQDLSASEILSKLSSSSGDFDLGAGDDEMMYSFMKLTSSPA